MKDIDQTIIEDEYYDCGYDEDNEWMIWADGEYYDPDEDPDITHFSLEERIECRKNMKKGNFLRDIFTFRRQPTDRLSFPTKIIQVGEDSCELYDIPENQIIDVINSIIKPNRLPETKNMYDCNEKKPFVVTELQIIRFNNANYIISPYFSNSGSTFGGCIPSE